MHTAGHAPCTDSGVSPCHFSHLLNTFSCFHGKSPHAVLTKERTWMEQVWHHRDGRTDIRTHRSTYLVLVWSHKESNTLKHSLNRLLHTHTCPCTRTQAHTSTHARAPLVRIPTLTIIANSQSYLTVMWWRLMLARVLREWTEVGLE